MNYNYQLLFFMFFGFSHLFVWLSISFQISKLPGGTQNKIGQVASIVWQIRVSIKHRTTGRTCFFKPWPFMASLYLDTFFWCCISLNMPFQAPSGTSRGVWNGRDLSSKCHNNYHGQASKLTLIGHVLDQVWVVWTVQMLVGKLCITNVK